MPAASSSVSLKAHSGSPHENKLLTALLVTIFGLAFLFVCAKAKRASFQPGPVTIEKGADPTARPLVAERCAHKSAEPVSYGTI